MALSGRIGHLCICAGCRRHKDLNHKAPRDVIIQGMEGKLSTRMAITAVAIALVATACASPAVSSNMTGSSEPTISAPHGSMFAPPASQQGDSVVFRMVLLDGTRMSAALPVSLAADVKGFFPGGAVGWDFGVCCGRALEVIHGSVTELYGNRAPEAVYVDAASRPVNFYAMSDGLDYLVFQFGSWVVRAWDDGPGAGERFNDETRTRFASLLDGYETPEGFLVLNPTDPMRMMPVDSPDATLTAREGEALVGIITGRECVGDASSVTSHAYEVAVSEESGLTSLCSPADSTVLWISRTGLTNTELDAIHLDMEPAEPR